MKPSAVTKSIVISCLLATAQAQLLSFSPSSRHRLATAPDRQQHPIMDSNNPGIVLPPPSSNERDPAPVTGDVILSDIIGNQRTIKLFAGFTRDVDSVSQRLETSGKNTTVLAPLNSAISDLPRKPWENPKDYQAMGGQAYAGQAGEDRAHMNLRRFVEAHIIPASPWKEGEKLQSMAGNTVWWEKEHGKAVLQPGNIEIDRVASRVANGEVWIVKGVVDYA